MQCVYNSTRSMLKNARCIVISFRLITILQSSMQYICTCKVVSSWDSLCCICSWCNLPCKNIWQVHCMILKPLELSSILVPMTLIPWSRQSPAEKEPPDVSVCSLSRLVLDTLPVGYAGVGHPWLVAVCPLPCSYDRRVPFLSRWQSLEDWFCHRG